MTPSTRANFRLARMAIVTPTSLQAEHTMRFTAVFRKVPEGYVVEELPGANTQGASLDEARAKR